MRPIELVDRLGRWSSGRGPLHLLLAARLRQLIDDGELPPGESLPPDRTLATALAVGRGTVVTSYEALRAEGRIVRRRGSGTRVAGTSTPTAPPTTTAAPVFLHLLEPIDSSIMFSCAAPDRPPPELIAAYEQVPRALAAMAGDIGYHPAGAVEFRAAIADRYTLRGVPTRPDQILVTTGAQQALSLLARALVAPGDEVLVEAPTYPGALEAFREEAAVVRSLPVGLPGFEQAVRGRLPAFAYVIPTCHNPTGTILSSLERQHLARAAADTGVPLIEDEVLADLAFPGEDVPAPMAAYADVISVGSLSKLVWGGLRIGWVRADPALIGRLARLRTVHDLGGNIPAQLAAADLLPRLDEPRRRRVIESAARHDHLRAELSRLLPSWVAPPVRGGNTLWVRLPYGDGASFAQTAARHGVMVLPGGGLDVSGASDDHVRLHFLLSPETLTEAVGRLAAAWRDYQPVDSPTPPSPAMAI